MLGHREHTHTNGSFAIRTQSLACFSIKRKQNERQLCNSFSPFEVQKAFCVLSKIRRCRSVVAASYAHCSHKPLRKEHTQRTLFGRKRERERENAQWNSPKEIPKEHTHFLSVCDLSDLDTLCASPVLFYRQIYSCFVACLIIFLALSLLLCSKYFI